MSTAVPMTTPNSPAALASSTRANRQIRRALPNSWEGMVYPAIPATATTMSTAGETILASTAAVPTTRPPMMDTVWPMDWGSRSPASWRISKASSSTTTSKEERKGTFCLASMMDRARRVGIISW